MTQSYLLFHASTNVAFTSIESYQNLKESGKLNSIKDYVLYALKIADKPLSNRMLSDLSGIETASLTAPIKSLLNDGLIVQDGIVKNKTGLCAKAYRISKLMA